MLWYQMLMHETGVYILLKFQHHSSVVWVLSIHLQNIKTELGRDVGVGLKKKCFFNIVTSATKILLSSVLHVYNYKSQTHICPDK